MSSTSNQTNHLCDTSVVSSPVRYIVIHNIHDFGALGDWRRRGRLHETKRDVTKRNETRTVSPEVCLVDLAAQIAIDNAIAVAFAITAFAITVALIAPRNRAVSPWNKGSASDHPLRHPAQSQPTRAAHRPSPA